MLSRWMNFRFGKALLSIILSAYTVQTLIIYPITGFKVDRYHRKNAHPFCCTVFSVLLGLSAHILLVIGILWALLGLAVFLGGLVPRLARLQSLYLFDIGLLFAFILHFTFFIILDINALKQVHSSSPLQTGTHT